MTKLTPVKWGIIGLGKIAHKFAQDLLISEDAELYAVASRSAEKATDFQKAYGATVSYANYEDLANDAEVDIVYIATPHVFHCELTLMCLNHGKHVLCEKAFGMNAGEVKKMIDLARQKQLFLMEALWTRFIPATEKLITYLNGGKIGRPLQVQADFGFRADNDPNKRLFNLNLGGGTLLDIGLYPVYISLLALGFPDEILGKAVFSQTGVDSACSLILGYKSGQMANLNATFLAHNANEAFIYGSEGYLKLDAPFHHSQRLSFYEDKHLAQSEEIPYVGNGYFHEISEVTTCLRTGKTESEKMPLDFSLKFITLLDQIRAEIGLKYPADDAVYAQMKLKRGYC